jgi:hypothetical protein
VLRPHRLPPRSLGMTHEVPVTGPVTMIREERSGALVSPSQPSPYVPRQVHRNELAVETEIMHAWSMSRCSRWTGIGMSFDVP